MAELVLTTEEFKKIWSSEKVATGEIRITAYKGTDTNIVVPSQVGKNTVVALGDFLFSPEKPRLNRRSIPFFENEIKSVILPDTVRNLGEGLFAGCKGLEQVILPATLDGVSAAAFRDCENLKSINIPENITFIEDYAFSGCKSLPAFDFPESLTYLGRQAIAFNPNFATITIPAKLEKIEFHKASFDGEGQALPFLFCDNIKEIRVAKDNPNYCDIDGVLYSKDKTELLYCPHKVSGVFIVPEGVTTIGSNAFGGCSGITEIILPSTLEVIRAEAFTEFAQRRWSGCGLKRITIPEGVTEISPLAFYVCKNLREVILPSTLKTIGDGAFSANGESFIEPIILPEGLEKIGDFALQAFTNEHIHLPNSVTTIGENVFGKKLKSTNIPMSMTCVPRSMFRGCHSVETVELHDGIKSLDSCCFFECTALKELVLPNSVEEIGYAAFMNSGIASITLSNHLKTIDQNAFSGCWYLESIDLPESLEHIGDNAFERCRNPLQNELEVGNLKSITIRGNNTEIGRSVFKACTRLTEFYIYGDTIDISNIGWGEAGGWPDFSESDPLFHVKKGSDVEKFVKKKGFKVEYLD